MKDMYKSLTEIVNKFEGYLAYSSKFTNKIYV